MIDSTKPDVIIATETWLHSLIHSSEYFSSHYNVYRWDRASSTSRGGVLLAVNSDFVSSREETLESDKSEWFG